MKIAVLSGKGGAGKTMVSVNLAAAAGKCTYIDCDVEEPNGHLFLKPENIEAETVSTLLPEFDAEKCTGCRKCVDFCRFHALVYIKEKPMIFPEVCHSCGGCSLVCPEGAVTERENPIGVLETGIAESVTVVTGILNPGEASGVPLIKKALSKSDGFTVIDCPPGSACSVMESITDADYCIIVAEPTAFGFHNFKMVHELTSLIKKPIGVVINKEDGYFPPLYDFCKEKNIDVLMTIPYRQDFATILAKGELIVEKSREGREMFTELLRKIGGGIK